MATFVPAVRRRARLRLALIGPSGAGKTFSALTIAAGFGGRWAVIDTERGSSELYADLFAFDVAHLTPPYTVERYLSLIHEAEAAGYDGVIIDTLSHAWAGEGGLLDLHEQLARRSPNTWSAWREVTPLHNRLVDAILHSPCHTIVTFRSRTVWDVQEGPDGRKRPVKIGLAPVFREGIEYEFTIVFELDPDHTAVVSKDRTGLFAGTGPFIIGPEIGEKIRTWLESGAAEPLPVPSAGSALLSSAAPADPPAIPGADRVPPAVWRRLAEAGIGPEDVVEYVTARWGRPLERLPAAAVVALRQALERVRSRAEFDAELAKYRKSADANGSTAQEATE